jgi:hypothetical protein
LNRVLIFSILSAALAAAPKNGTLSSVVQRKIDMIQGGHARPGAVFSFSETELNAWIRYKVPQVVSEGVRQPRLELGAGVATAYALVDFVKARQGQGQSTNWLIAKLIEGEKAVMVKARIESARGRATVYLQRVEIGGLAVSGNTLDILIRTFFLPFYPNAKIDEPFELVGGLDRIETSPGRARAVMKK